MNNIEFCPAFLNRESIAGESTDIYDYVGGIGESHPKKIGSLFSLITIETDPKFLVEFEENGDIELRQSQLFLIAHDG